MRLPGSVARASLPQSPDMQVHQERGGAAVYLPDTSGLLTPCKVPLVMSSARDKKQGSVRATLSSTSCRRTWVGRGTALNHLLLTRLRRNAWFPTPRALRAKVRAKRRGNKTGSMNLGRGQKVLKPYQMLIDCKGRMVQSPLPPHVRRHGTEGGVTLILVLLSDWLQGSDGVMASSTSCQKIWDRRAVTILHLLLID